MKKKIILSTIGAVSISAASAQTTSVNFDQLAMNCLLVVEKNNLKNQMQHELTEFYAELETYKQLWWDICYAAIEDPSTTSEEIQYLIANTYSDIDSNQLITDLNKALQGIPVTRRAMPQQPDPDKSPRVENPKSQSELNDESGEELNPGVTEPAKMDPTKKVNDPGKTVKEEKKENKTTLRPDELVKKRKKNNNN